MKFQHAQLAAGRWAAMSLCEQMANVGSEVERAIARRNKGDRSNSEAAFYRALELLDLTIRFSRGFCRRRELARTRELLTDHFAFDNEYDTSDHYWQELFRHFTWAAAMQRRRPESGQTERG